MALPSLILRTTKGSALTYAEADANFTNLSTASTKVLVGSTTTTLALNDTLTLAAGANVTLTANSATQTITIASAAGSSGLANVVEDLTPQLGGDLDINGKKIVSTSNAGIYIEPNGTGDVYLTADQTVFGDLNSNATLTTYGSGDLILNTDSGNNSGSITIADGANQNITLTPNGTGKVVLDANQWPNTDGVAGQILVTDGAGQLEWKYQEILTAKVINADSVTINKGEPVYVFSAQGDLISVKRALNTSDATSAQTLGLAAGSIAASAEGVVICQGVLTNVDTGSYTAGQGLYLGSTAGSKTTTKPYAPNHLVYLGFVEKINASSGRIYVRVQNGYELDEIHDVNINHNVSIANKDYLVYNTSNSLWENRQLDIVNDLTPQLGGDLDINGKKIVSTSNGNIALEPNGTGKVTATSNIETTGDVKAFQLFSTQSSGDEGGEIKLAKPVTNTSIGGTGVNIDVYQNKLRIWEDGGTNRGAYIDLTAAGASVSTNLLAGGGGSAGVSSISFGSTGLTPSSATTGTVLVGGVLNVANGGLGTSEVASAGMIPVSNGSNYFPRWLTAGSNITITTSSSAIVISASGGGGGDTVYTGGNITGSYTPSISSGTIHTYTLTGNVTINSVTAITTGQTITLILTQDGTGGRTLSSTMKFANGYKTLSVGASTTDMVSVTYVGGNYYATLVKGYA